MTLLLEVKLDSHIKQAKSFFFAFSWSDITCFFMSLWWLKVELHILHQYKGFFPSWTVWIWVFKLTFVAKDASHISHLLSLLLSWISLIWVFRYGLWVKFLSQTVHGKGFFFHFEKILVLGVRISHLLHLCRYLAGVGDSSCRQPIFERQFGLCFPQKANVKWSVRYR